MWAYSLTIAGDYHTIGLKADGTAWAWENNGYGQLGDGTTTDSSSLVQVVDSDGTGFLNLNVSAELRIDSISPLFGTAGQDLEVTLTGAGFDENTRVSMSPDVGNKKDIIGAVDTPGSALGVAITGDKAYVANWVSGLQVIDISDPAKPVIIGSVDTPGSACGVVVTGDKAYVADGGSGLQIIDISDPTKPHDYRLCVYRCNLWSVNNRGQGVCGR